MPPAGTVTSAGDTPTDIAGGVTEKPAPLLASPPIVTTTLPLVAPLGTGVTIAVGLQLVGLAGVPLNVTLLPPCVAPKFAPVIVTDVPAIPDEGFRPVILGGMLPAELGRKATRDWAHATPVDNEPDAEAFPAED